MQAERSRPLVLTPHAGEFARLMGESTQTVVANRLALSREFAMKYKLYLILKGHHTLIAGLLAQFFPEYPLEMILPAAVFLHGYAADLAIIETGQMSLTASDIIRYIPRSIIGINEFRSHFPVS